MPLAVAAACWVALLWLHRAPPMPAHTGSHHSMVNMTGSGSVEAVTATTSVMSIGPWMGMWTLMCAAMMIPTVIPAIRHVGANSLRRRAGRSITVFTCTYVACWVVFGLAAFAFVTGVRWFGVPDGAVIFGVILIAIVWLALPLQQRFRWACHNAVPLPPTGWPAVRRCAEFGARQALACIGICWPLMLLMALLMDASIVWMFAIAAVVTVWKYLPRRFRRRLAWVRTALAPGRRHAGVALTRRTA